MNSSSKAQSETAALLTALEFAAQRHSGQTRKKNGAPYINHPIAVAEILARVGGVTDAAVLQAAFLHDLLEDTDTSAQEIADRFGHQVLSLVGEVTDDKSLPKQERKQAQLQGAASLSIAAKLIRIGDKISNVLDITPTQPSDWSNDRKQAYLDWAEQVVTRCRGTSQALEQLFEQVVRSKRAELEGKPR
jgi:guanosine-3',5'-bis(diphosphate) 3'-pyrophosphohydrolase